MPEIKMDECGYRHCNLGPEGTKKKFPPLKNKRFCCSVHRNAEYNLLHPRIDVENPEQVAMFKDVQLPTAPISTLQKEIEKKEKGLDQVKSHSVDFVSRMREIAKRIALEKGRVSTDDLRFEAQRLGISPNHKNAWGSVFNTPEWVAVDRKKSEFIGNHSREIKVWSLNK